MKQFYISGAPVIGIQEVQVLQHIILSGLLWSQINIHTPWNPWGTHFDFSFHYLHATRVLWFNIYMLMNPSLSASCSRSSNLAWSWDQVCFELYSVATLFWFHCKNDNLVEWWMEILYRNWECSTLFYLLLFNIHFLE